MKNLDEMIAVMEASKTKPIQFKQRHRETEWLDVMGTPQWNWFEYDFRVKPEEKKPNTIRCKHHADGSFTVTASWDLRDGVVEFIELTPEVKAKLGL